MKKGKKIDFAKIAMNTVGVSAGAVAGEIASSKLAPNLNPTYKGLGQMGLGVALPVLVPGMEILESVGNGMIAGGALTLAQSLVPNMFEADTQAPVSGIGEEAFVIDEDFEVSGSGDEYDSSVDGPDVLAGDDPGMNI